MAIAPSRWRNRGVLQARALPVCGDYGNEVRGVDRHRRSSTGLPNCLQNRLSQDCAAQRLGQQREPRSGERGTQFICSMNVLVGKTPQDTAT
jgi:hypothetical protein